MAYDLKVTQSTKILCIIWDLISWLLLLTTSASRQSTIPRLRDENEVVRRQAPGYLCHQYQPGDQPN